jgi:hypothetical protein
MRALDSPKHLQLEESAGFDRRIIDYIQHAAASGLYEIRGLGAKRRVPHFDDLVFLAGSASRYPLEGYREKCSTKTVLGTRFARNPIELAIPITFAGMSFGSLSAHVKEALGRAATELGTTTTTGDGGMTREERQSSKTLVYQCLPSRYGFNPDDLREADAIELVIGQGAKPGGGGMLLGQKISARVSCPTIGIGAGPHCDGQVLVIYDLLGMNPDFNPRFLKKYAQLGKTVSNAVRDYVREVKVGSFPDKEHSFARGEVYAKPGAKKKASR